MSIVDFELQLFCDNPLMLIQSRIDPVHKR